MNRRSFLKFLGIGTATAAVAPKMLADSTKIPVTTQDWIWRNEWGPLVTWQESEGRADYSIGVDVGSGLGHSPSCVSVMRMGGIGQPDLQVAEFVSDTVIPPDLALVVAQIANKYKVNCIDSRGPMLVIEQVRGYGDVVQVHLKIMGFTRFFQTQRAKMEDGAKEGFYATKNTTFITRVRFLTAISLGWYKPKSVTLKEDLSHPDKELHNHPHFMAAAQSYIGAHAFEDFDVPKVPNVHLKYLEYIEGKIRRQLGLSDIQALQRIKRNG